MPSCDRCIEEFERATAKALEGLAEQGISFNDSIPTLKRIVDSFRL